jgi:predicted anti-sigma-YlaC factor YlaD
MSCPFEENVSALFDGELDAAEVARVQAHIDTCDSCRAFLEDAGEIRGSMRVLDRIAPAAPRRSVWRRRIAVPLPIAAILALAIVLVPVVTLLRRPAAPALNDVFTRYDGGRRAVIYVRPQESQP